MRVEHAKKDLQTPTLKIRAQPPRALSHRAEIALDLYTSIDVVNVQLEHISLGTCNLTLVAGTDLTENVNPYIIKVVSFE